MNLSGFALAGYLNDLERKQKRASKNVGILDKEVGASEDYQGAQQRTKDWLASLSPEELAKVSPESKRVPSTFEGVGDVANFDLDRRSRDLGLTSTFADDPGVQSYLGGLEKQKLKKTYDETTAALEDANRTQQIDQQYGNIEELEKQAGLTPGGYSRKSPREIAIGSGLPSKIADPRVSKYMEKFVEEPEALEKGITSRSYSAQLLNSATPEDYRKANDLAEAIISANGFSDDSQQAIGLRNAANVNPKKFTQDSASKMFSTEEQLRGKEESIPIDVAKIEALIEPKAATTAALTEAEELKKREIQKGEPIISETQSGALNDSYNAVRHLSTLKNELAKGNVDYFDIDKKTGQFKNPQVANAFEQMVEIIGRKRSGAAINESEWESFGKQVLNKNFLTVNKEGKKVALDNIDKLLDMFYGAGTLVAGDDNWYNTHKSRLTKARQQAESENEELRPTTQTDIPQTDIPQEDIDLAMEALNDPDAPLDVKALAKFVKKKAGIQ